jgi:CDGSH-type Zn-finger protein
VSDKVWPFTNELSKSAVTMTQNMMAANFHAELAKAVRREIVMCLCWVAPNAPFCLVESAVIAVPVTAARAPYPKKKGHARLRVCELDSRVGSTASTN